MTSKVSAMPATRPVWRKWVSYGLFAVFAIWCALAFKKDIAQIDMAPMRDGWFMVLAAGALSLLNYVLRIVRWQVYLRQLGVALPWQFVSTTFMAGFAFTLSPGKLGEMVRARYYVPLGIPMASVSGAFFVERLLDLVVMILLAVTVLSELQVYQQFLWASVILVVGALFVVAAVPWTRVAQAAERPDATRWTRWARPVARMFASAKRFLSPSVLAMGLLLGAVAWGAEAVGLKLLCDVVKADQISLAGAMGVYSIAIIVGALSFLPGGLGSTEVVMTGLLYAHGYPMPQAILITLVCRLLTLWLAVVIGWLCVWSLRR